MRAVHVTELTVLSMWPCCAVLTHIEGLVLCLRLAGSLIVLSKQWLSAMCSATCRRGHGTWKSLQHVTAFPLIIQIDYGVLLRKGSERVS